KEHVGVFASRSPFRPNGLGLSSVKIEGIDYSESKGPIIKVSGVDMLDGTPIYDIKPYIPYTDCITDATDGYTEHTKDYRLQVVCPDNLLSILPEDKRSAVVDVLALDPRPTFLNAPNRIYGMYYAEYNIKFKVDGLVLTVVDIQKELQ
ncbi:MAG: SAM-dependent methyltransferase, partial [Bacteroidales bacterium]|nr:SAM-dependent methyltransferase [Bacteroidales bacterium]